MRTFAIVLLPAALAASVTWFAMRQFAPSQHTASGAATGTHKAHSYQCSMHPWIKSEKPGRCTICGMELTPTTEGDKSMEQTGTEAMVTLTQNQVQVLHVQTVEAQIRPLTRTLRVAGMITENTMRHRVLAAYVDGRIDKLHVNYLGAEVTAGQPLADFYSPTLLQAEREYRQLGGELRKNTALRLRQMGLSQEQINALDDKSSDALTSQILSPISGTVVTQAVYQGQYVATGAQLLEIADFSTMWFVFRAYEQDMPWIRTGQAVRITAPALPEKSFTGQITFIDPNFDDATRSAKVRVELPNPLADGKRELLNRFYAEGLVELETPSVLTVPRAAVIETGPAAVVYIDRTGGAYQPAVVKTGRRGDTLVEVLSGLKEGDSVVTNGNLLIDGQAELNRAFMTPPEPDAAATPAPAPALNDAQQQTIAAFVKLADALAVTLGTDDAAAFNASNKQVAAMTETMIRQLRPLVADGKTLDAMEEARHFHDAANLLDARTAFHKFSVAATAVLQPLRKAAGMPDFKIYECGMVNQAVPGAPKKGRWIQAANREMLNPFFGKEMPDCGVEINR